jgi:uncharacterized protein
MSRAGCLTALPLLMSLTMTFGAARAAGFDCTKAATAQEKTICQDPTLNALDEQLAAAYRDATRRCPASALKQQQQQWLKRIRKACSDAPCLNTVYQKRLAELQSRSCPLEACTASGQSLLGAWQLASDAGSFEEISFAAGQTPNQGRFDTWLHSRPEFSDGRWQLHGCELRLIPPGEAEAGAVLLTVKSVSADTLEVLEAGESQSALYRRINP